jgi:transcriptional regulator of heat shock response
MLCAGDSLCEFKRRYDATPTYTLPVTSIQSVEWTRSRKTAIILALNTDHGKVEKWQLRYKTETDAEQWTDAIHSVRSRRSMRQHVFSQSSDESDEQSDEPASAEEAEAEVAIAPSQEDSADRLPGLSVGTAAAEVKVEATAVTVRAVVLS